MPPLRCLIDSMVFDAIVAEPPLLGEIDRLTSAGRLELLAALETMNELESTPDAARRRQLQRVRVLVVAPADVGRPETGRLLDVLRGSTGVSDEDARIALAAATHGVPLVTEDRGLRLAVSSHLPQVPVWTWPTELRPRIATLAGEHPPASTQRRGRAGTRPR